METIVKGIALIVGILLFVVMVHLMATLIPDAILPLLEPEPKGVRYYHFPEGLTPVSHYHGARWLCENEAGEYLECLPTIERKVSQ